MNGRFTVSSGGHYARDVVGSSTTGCVPHVTSPYRHTPLVRFIRIRYLYIFQCDSAEFSKDTKLFFCVAAPFIVVYVLQGGSS